MMYVRVVAAWAGKKREICVTLNQPLSFAKTHAGHETGKSFFYVHRIGGHNGTRNLVLLHKVFN
jgi:hypothetical protein